MSQTYVSIVFFYKTLNCLRMQGTTLKINIHSVRFITYSNYVCPKFPQYCRRYLVSSAVCAVYDDFEPLKVQPFRDAVFYELDVSALCIVNPEGLSKPFPCRSQIVYLSGINELLNFQLIIIRKFETILRKEFNAVIFEKIMGRRYNNTCICPETPC